MTDFAAGPAISPRRQRNGLLRRLISGLKNLIFGTALCLTPPTAIVVLGWLVRMMRAVSLRRLGVAEAEIGGVGWIIGDRGTGPAQRLVGSAWLNLRAGLGSLVALLLATLPFTGLWIMSWWAGWENSFNKGYEQSWVGPVVGLAGVAVGLWVMTHLPMALAHRAVEQRWLALFEVRRIRALTGHAGWRCFALALATVLAALPLSAAKGLPVFIEQIVPGFADMGPEEQAQVAGRLALAKAAYIFVALVVLRRWAAGLYARSVPRAIAASETVWRGSAVQELLASRPAGDASSPRSRGVFRLVGRLMLLVVWFGLVVQIYVTQFLNHAWWNWISHPLLVLPWAG